MALQVRIFATLRDLLGAKQIEAPVDVPTTIGMVLQALGACYPALEAKLWNPDGELNGSISVLVNGRSINFLAGLDTPVGPEDTLALFPPIGGG